MESFEKVESTLSILSSFTPSHNEQTLAEIASRIKKDEKETKILIDLLVENQFIEYREASQKYKLTHKVYYLGYVARCSLHLQEIAHPIMKKISGVTNQTVNLFLLQENFRICIEQSIGNDTVNGLIEKGDRLPLWTGASGKVLLAYQTEEFKKEIFRTIPPHIKIVEINKKLEQIRIKGYCWEEDVRNSGFSAIAFPIFDVDGKVMASLSITGPTHHFTRSSITSYEGC
ncbi:IclR family transcriptional regulator [Halalkalibacterium halodurans]|uniref:IclR family transcriptional regulator n=1 Tax=Halalkalibacterium halodurans TaxID=86665 RepID=UPI002AAA272C|nr:IclR family transcriptional regulator [Halalkalibacterium halodurans]MDY7220923.1 IclR family transcriptional regulator [Halalkalibacterium halodurans]MDY7240162.1 IclR family transcriptional regulator [Halalkalibacterium halodurans]